MYNTHNAARATGQGNCDTPRYFVSTKRGWRRYVPPTGEAPFAVMHRGRWCPVFRAATDAEYFRDHPEAAWRFTVRRFSASYFTFESITRDGSTIADGDVWDVYGKLDYCGGSPRERLRRAARRLLADPNRAYPAAWVA